MGGSLSEIFEAIFNEIASLFFFCSVHLLLRYMKITDFVMLILYPDSSSQSVYQNLEFPWKGGSLGSLVHRIITFSNKDAVLVALLSDKTS